MRFLVIIPTYNERDNVVLLATEIFQRNLGTDILVVDDNSPDGTAQVVNEFIKTTPRMHLLSRPQKQGLGRAYLAGFKWGIDNGYDVLIEMDSDFSHRPEDLERLIKSDWSCDFKIGSRYVSGGGTINWGLGRKLISRFGSLYAQMILWLPFNDLTGGFNAWKVSTLKAIGLDNVMSNGYSFQIELKYRAHRLHFKGIEIPIVFNERRVGQSKMSSRIVVEALWKVWGLRFAK